MRHYTLAELSALPTLSQGHTDDLKIETKGVRVWLSRMTVEDGMPYDNQVTVEKLYCAAASSRKPSTTGTRWVTAEEYEAE